MFTLACIVVVLTMNTNIEQPALVKSNSYHFRIATFRRIPKISERDH